MTLPIVRRWGARATTAAVEHWLRHERVTPGYREAGRSRGVRIPVSRGLSPDDAVAGTEWTDTQAVERLSGPTPERAVMPDRVTEPMPDHETQATHYEAVPMEDNR